MSDVVDLATSVFDGLSEREITEVLRMAHDCDNRDGETVEHTTGNHPYAIRRCRGHFHVTSSVGDLILPGDPFGTREEAREAMRSLTRDLTTPEERPV